MTKEQFYEIVNNRIAQTKHLLTVKGLEYIRNNDPLHNFNVGESITGKSKAEVLDGMMLKHYISYRDLLDDMSNHKEISKSQMKEKIGDLIVYLCIQETIFEEYIDKSEDSKSIEPENRNI